MTCCPAATSAVSSGSDAVFAVLADSESWALLEAARRGDRESLAVLYRAHVGEVRRYIQARVPNRHLAEDFTSEVFVRVMRARSVRRQDGKFRGWLITIGRNIVIDHFKSRYNQAEIPVDVLPEDGRFELSAEQLVLRRQLREEVRDGLARLGPDQRECLRLRFLEDRSVAETALLLGRGEAAVRQLQLRAIRKLEGLLAWREIAA